MPIVGYYMPAYVNVLILTLMYLSIFNKNGLNSKDFCKLIPIFGVDILSILYGDVNNLMLFIYKIYQTFIYPIIGLYLIKKDDPISTRRIFNIIGISIIITCITTYRGCTLYPYASREIAAMLSSEDPALYALYVKQNIGSFAFTYTLVLILPIVIYLIKNNINRLISISCIIIIITTIFKTEYTTALMFMALCMVTMFISKQYKVKHIIFFLIIILLLYLSSKQIIAIILEKIANNLNSELFSERLHELSYSILYGKDQASGDLEARISLYESSFNNFINNPIWGSNSYGGGHSYILDNMGKFGLLGIIAMIFMYLRIYKIFLNNWRYTNYYGNICLILFIAIIFAIVNPKENLFTLTFIIPLFTVSFKNNKI